MRKAAMQLAASVLRIQNERKKSTAVGIPTASSAPGTTIVS